MEDGDKTGEEEGNRIHRLLMEIRATLVDHVGNHDLTMAEVGQRVQPLLGVPQPVPSVRHFLGEQVSKT